jgi:ATP-binding cassette, subfamily B, bacterial
VNGERARSDGDRDVTRGVGASGPIAGPPVTQAGGDDAELAARRAGWRLMGGAIRPQARWVVAGILAGLTWTAARVTIPLLAAAGIDEGILKSDEGAVARFAVLIVAVGVVQGVSTGLRRYSAFRIALRVETNLRERLFAHLQRLHFAFHDEAQTGQLMARANSDMQQIHVVVVLLPLTAASLLTMAAVMVIITLKSPGLALLVLVTLPFLNVAATRFTRRIQPVTLQLQQELADLSGVVEESVAGVRVVKGFGAERLQATRLRREADSVRDRSLDAARLRAGFIPLVDLLPTMSLVAILWYGGHQVLNGDLDLGYLVAFNSYVLMLIWPMRMLGMLLAQASRSSAAAGRVHEILATEPAVADRTGARPLPDGPGELRFEGVRFAYGGRTGPPVLDGLDLVVRGGEAVALVGSTGSGKTTVARMVPRFYDVDAGRVLLDGVDVRNVELRELRRSVGIVFEDTFLFSDTVRANIAFADPEASMDAVERAARLAGAAGFVEHLPDGYDTLIGEHGFSLSGGQRQRIAIARAVLADPRVLILDDATSSVDPTKEHEIRSALREVMADRTTLIIAHRPATIALADRVVLLGDGRVLAHGTHEELLARSARYRAVLAQAEAAEAQAAGVAR